MITTADTRCYWVPSALLVLMVAGCREDVVITPCPTDPPSEPAGVRLVPDKMIYGIDERVVTTVTIEVATNADTVSFNLEYNPAVLSYVGSEEGEFMNGDGSKTLFGAAPIADDGVMVSVSRLSECPGVSGTGVVATLEFLAVGDGDGGIRFSGAGIYDPQGQSMTGHWNALPIRVEP